MGSTSENPFGSLLREWRLTRKVSQETLARQAGVAVRTLRYWEAGETLPGTAELECVLSALQVNTSEKRLAYSLIPRPRTHRLDKALLRQSNDSGANSNSNRSNGHTITLPHSGDLIRAMRLRAGKTQTELATELGITPTTLIRWETLRTFPTGENLSRLCLLLSASPEETEALATRYLTPPDMIRGNDIDLLTADFSAFQELINRQSPLVDLHALALIRRLSILAEQSPEAYTLLARTKQAYSNVLFLKHNISEAKSYAEQAIQIFVSIRQFDKHWAHSINLLSNFVGKHSLTESGDRFASRPVGRARFILRHLKVESPGLVKMQLYCDLALYFSLEGRTEEATRTMQEAEALYHSLPEIEPVYHYYTLSHARVLFNQGTLERATSCFEKVIALNPLNPFYRLYQAETLLSMGERDMAIATFDQALKLVENSTYHLMRERVYAFAHRL